MRPRFIGTSRNRWSAPIIGLAMAAAGLAVAGCSSSTTSAAPAAEAGSTTTIAPPTTTTTVCSLNGTGQAVPIDSVCSSAGAPHFTTPQAAMTYLASAWNSDNVQEIDYVTDPAGREQMDAMAAQMPNLSFKSCTQNPAGDYTCYFNHDIVPSHSSTTFPNPAGYPAGEAVFTVAPAEGPGWYLTQVLHCG